MTVWKMGGLGWCDGRTATNGSIGLRDCASRKHHHQASLRTQRKQPFRCARFCGTVEGARARGKVPVAFRALAALSAATLWWTPVLGFTLSLVPEQRTLFTLHRLYLSPSLVPLAPFPTARGRLRDPAPSKRWFSGCWHSACESPSCSDISPLAASSCYNAPSMLHRLLPLCRFSLAIVSISVHIAHLFREITPTSAVSPSRPMDCLQSGIKS